MMIVLIWCGSIRVSTVEIFGTLYSFCFCIFAVNFWILLRIISKEAYLIVFMGSFYPLFGYGESYLREEI